MPSPMNVLADKARHMGDTYTWYLNPAPKDGEVWGPYERTLGRKFSHGNPRDRDGKYRAGSGFYSLKFSSVCEASGPSTTFRGGEQRAYAGCYYVDASYIYDYSTCSFWGIEDDAINQRAYAYGAQALASLRPDRPDFSPFESLAEMAFSLSSLEDAFKNVRQAYLNRVKVIERRTGHRMSKAGKYYLSLQFGWLPLLRDAQNWFEAYHNATKRARELVKNNGKWVKKSVHLSPKPDDSFHQDKVSSAGTAYNGDMRPTHVTQCYTRDTSIGGGIASTVHTSRYMTRTWAKGKSKYWLPEDMVRTPQGFNRLKRKLSGNMDITLEHVWNIIPWSWFADYFFEFGSFFKAVSGGISDCLIWEYAYVMRSEDWETRHVYTQYVYTSPSSAGKTTCTVRRIGSLKSRVPASIFGFGFSGPLSGKQGAILGALGLSRL